MNSRRSLVTPSEKFIDVTASTASIASSGATRPRLRAAVFWR